MTGPAPPRLLGGDGIAVTRRIQTMLRCLKCRKSLDITDVKVGTTIGCPECGNITWAPEYVPRWWYRMRNFVLSLIIALAVGVAASLTADFLRDRLQDSPDTTSASEPIGANNGN